MPPLAPPVSRRRSQTAFAEAKTLLPGGVNSPVRAFQGVAQETADTGETCHSPVFIQRAQGPHLWDIDDNCYIDYVGSWGPAILGHAHPDVIARIQATAALGTTFGAPTLYETELARLVRQLVPSVEKIRFVSSGTEAAMSVIRLARAATGRAKLIKFTGCYHGHADALLVKAGSGATTLGVPDSAGTLPATVAETLLAPFNNLAAVEALLAAYPDEVAAVLVEPVAGNMGCVPPLPGFLAGLRALTKQYGALLVFDEVMTGFRVALGGAQAHYGVTPDLTAFGKIIGGGLPAAAYGGRADLMALVAPEGPMYQAGTLSGNPLAMVAGLETLRHLQAPGVYAQLNDTAQQLARGIQARCTQAGVPVTVHQVGGMFSVFFHPGPVNAYEDALACDLTQFKRFFWGLLETGIYWPPSAFEACFVSLAHGPTEIAQTLTAVERVLGLSSALDALASATARN
jgi:glutamate-1-semialdehyde 2,1-aminomutase